MHDTTAIAKPLPPTPEPKPPAGKNADPRYAALYRQYPTIDYLRRRARARLPYFAFEYCDGGSGKDDAGIKRNWAALDAVELVPRYGVMPSLPPCDVELFGRRYAAPIGIAPMGGPAVVWPGADIYLARAAQRARVPYTLGTVGCATIEKIAEDCARRVLVSALSRRSQRSRHRLRSCPPRASCGLPRAGADARRPGAHYPRARSGSRSQRRLPCRLE